jgi:hypothetical protein
MCRTTTTDTSCEAIEFDECETEEEWTTCEVKNFNVIERDKNLEDLVDDSTSGLRVGRQYEGEDSEQRLVPMTEIKDESKEVTHEEDDHMTANKKTVKEYVEDVDYDDELSDVDMEDLDLQDLLDLESDDIASAKVLEANIPESFIRPLALDQPNRLTSPSNYNFTSPSRSSLVMEPLEIHAVEVILTEIEMSDQEVWLYNDGQLGRFRCRFPSPLRKCWTLVKWEV